MPDVGACVSYSPVYGFSVPFSRRMRNCSADKYVMSQFCVCVCTYEKELRAEKGGWGGNIRRIMMKSQQIYTFRKDSSPFILAFLHRVRG